jgi:CheY-like chemotaxis protein
MANVLIIEDDPEMSAMYHRAFQLAGQEVELAKDGQEGMSKIREMQPELKLIFLDIMMPKMNGMEVLTELKNNPKTTGIPVVALTNISSGTLRMAQEAVEKKWAIRYLVKSDTDPEEVVKLAGEILREKVN